MDKRKEIKLTYKENPPPMGVFQIKNNINGKIFVGSGANLPGMLNRQRFQLSLKAHPNKPLQADWEQYGADAFSFETLETKNTSDIPQEARRDTLTALEEKWLSKTQPYDDKGYNIQKQ